MTVIMNEVAEADLDKAFAYYESLQRGLGTRFVTEFRRAIERILAFPRGWHAMDETYRRCQLHVFPYGVIYRIDETAGEIVVVAVSDLRQAPDTWRGRE